MASIKYMVIEKSITDDLSYGIKNNSTSKESVSEGLIVVKTGKEIKDTLQAELSICVQQKMALYEEMTKLIQTIGKLPESSYKDDYLVNGWEGKIELPKKYCYGEIYIKSDSEQDSNVGVGKEKEMREYNEISRKYIVASIEIKKLSTIINYIDEKKSFKLSIDLASKLGF